LEQDNEKRKTWFSAAGSCVFKSLGVGMDSDKDAYCPLQD